MNNYFTTLIVSMQAPIVYYTMQCWYINIINKEKNELSQSHWCQCQAFFLIKANKHYLYVNISVFQIKTFVITKKGHFVFICFVVRYSYSYPGLCQLPYQDVHRSSLSINWPSGPISGLIPTPTSQSRPVSTVDLWRPWLAGIWSMTGTWSVRVYKSLF